MNLLAQIRKVLDDHCDDGHCCCGRIDAVYCAALPEDLAKLWPEPSREELEKIFWPSPMCNMTQITFNTVQDAHKFLDRIMSWATSPGKAKVWCKPDCPNPWKPHKLNWYRGASWEYSTETVSAAVTQIQFCDRCGAKRPAATGGEG